MKKRSTGILLGSLITGLLVSTPMQAEEAHKTSSKHSAAPHSSHHDYHPNLFGLFLGFTHEGRRENAGSLGLEYERRIDERFGIGALAEHAFGDHSFWIYAVPLAFHFGQWKAFIAPGVEDSSEHGSEFLFRFGAEYGFEVGPIEIAPQLNIDIVDSDMVAVLGVVFAIGF